MTRRLAESINVRWSASKHNISDSAAFSDVIASVQNSSMAKSLNEDKEVTFIDM